MSTEKNRVVTGPPHSTARATELESLDGHRGPAVEDAAAGAEAALAASSAADRRAHHRIQVMLEVDYRAADTFLFAYITDISAMGIFVRTPQPEPPGTHLFLRFTPASGDDPIECEGDVIWINPPREGRSKSPGMGIQFTELTDELRRSIVELVRTFAWLDAEDEKPQNCH